MNRIVRIGLITLAALLVLLGAALLFLRSSYLHQRLLTMIIEHTQQQTGGRVEIGDYTIHWSGLHVDLYRVALHGTETDIHAPLFSSDHLGLGLKLVSLWKQEIDLREIVADHPVVHFAVDANGNTNLPKPPQPSQPVDLFDQKISHVVVNHGEIYYNDRRMPLDAEVRDLQAQISRQTLKNAYDAAIGYRDGRVQFSNFNPLLHGLDVKFTAAPSGLTVTSLVLTTGSSRISAQGSFQNYSNPDVDATYQAVLSGAELGKLLKNSLLPAGEVTTTGTVHYQNASGQPFVENLSVQGQMTSPLLALDLPEARTSVRALKADYQLEHGDFAALHLHAALLGGNVSGDVKVEHLTGKPEALFEGNGRLVGKLEGISLAAANEALTSRPLERLTVDGRLDGTIEASWRSALKDLQVRSDDTIAASAPSLRGISTNRNALPVNGDVHVAYDGRNNVVTLENTFLRTAHTTVNLEGTLGKQSSIQIQAQSNDLREVDLLAAGFRGIPADRAHPYQKQAPLLGLGGSASFRGQLQGTTNDPRISGQLAGENVWYQGANLRTLRTQVNLISTSIALHQGELQTISQGTVHFDITAGLRDWSYDRRSAITARVVANNLPVADLQHLANLRYPVSGILSGNVSLQGTQINPVGQGSLRLTGASAWDQPIQDFSMQFDGTGNSLHATATVRTPAGSGSGKVTYDPRNQRYDVQFDFPRLQVDRIQAVRARNLEVAGLMTVSARGQGTLTNPQLEATLDAPKLQIRREELALVKAHGNLAGQLATFTVSSTVEGAPLQAHGTVTLNANYDASANIDTQGIEIGPLLASYLHGRSGNVTGQTELHGTLAGPLKYPERVEAHVDVPKLTLAYQQLQLAAASPIRIDYRAGIVTLERAEFKGTGTDLQLQATVPIAAGGAVSGTATGTLDLQMVHLIMPDWESSGQVKLDVHAQGTSSHPDVQGVARVINGAFQMPDAPLGAEKVNAEFTFLRNRVDIKSFTAQSGGGNVTAQGYAIYQPSVQFNVALSGRGVRLRYPEGVRAVLVSDLNLTGTSDGATLTGQVLINRVSFTQAFDLATFANQFIGPSSPPSEGFTEKIKLDVSLRSTREMDLSSSAVSVQGSVDLQVRGTASEPVLIGRTNITSGEVFFNGRRYEVQSGVIQFANPVRTEPVVNLQVTTTVNQFSLNMNLVGPIDRMRTSYTSDPPLPPVDVINLLVTGHTAEAGSSSPSTPQSVLAGQMAGQVSSRVGKLVGISSLTIDPQIGGNNQGNAGTRLAIQQRVTKNLFFTFATDVTNTQGQVVQVEYQVTPKYSLSAVRDQNGGYSMQVKVRKKF